MFATGTVLEHDDLGPSLTDQQEAAVRFDGGHLLIVAGAGTGKTSTLAARLAHLVQRGTPPERIMLLTFSRRAAAELTHRAELLAGAELARACWSGTFHAVANRLLRRYGRALGLPPDFTVLDQPDAADLLNLLRDERGNTAEGSRRRTRKDALPAILSRVVNAQQPLSEVLERHFPWCRDDRDDLRATFTAYTERKRAHHILDYDDLLRFWCALHATPETQQLLAERFDHVLVDEYQDTNALQAEILDGLAAGGATITAVGDDAQAIYGFRAATVRNILEFPARFGAEMLVLTHNHRSTPQILAATNALMQQTTERHAKDLEAVRPSGPRPEVVRCHDEQHQSAEVCRRILGLVERGITLREQAVLVRTGHHTDLLELELTARRIPFHKYGGLRFLEAAHIKDLLALLRLVVNPSDELAWFRLLQRIDGVGPSRARRLVAHLATERGDIDRAITLGLLPGASREPAVALAEALADARDPALAERPSEQIGRVRRWLDPVIVARHPQSAARLSDLERLQLAAATSPRLDQFITELVLDPPSATGDLAGPPHLDDDVLTLSTVHSAKGGEWSAVHVIHLADGSFPSDMSTGTAEDIDEERRLLYVALTRARDHLFGYVPLRFHRYRLRQDDLHTFAQQSRFLTPEVLTHFDETTAGAAANSEEPDVPYGAAVTRIDAALDALLD